MDSHDPKRRLFRSRFLPYLFKYYERSGGDPARLLRAQELDRNLLTAAEVTVPLSTFWDLSEEMSADLGDPHFGVAAAHTTLRGDMGILEFLLETAATLGEGLSQYTRFASLAASLLKHRIDSDTGGLVVRQWVPDEPRGLGRHGNEFALALILHGCRRLAHRTVSPSRMWFSHPAGRDRRALATFFGTEAIEFDQTSNGMAFDAEVANLRLRRADAQLNSALRSQLAYAEAESGRFIDLVVEKTELALRSGSSSIEEVASALHMSGRTLQRRLRAEGSSFREAVAMARQRQAAILLKNPDLTIAEIAFLLGYTGVNAFGRAYKKWTGRSPGELRRAIVGGSG